MASTVPSPIEEHLHIAGEDARLHEAEAIHFRHTLYTAESLIVGSAVALFVLVVMLMLIL